jgi:hypothetical protein
MTPARTTSRISAAALRKARCPGCPAIADAVVVSVVRIRERVKAGLERARAEGKTPHRNTPWRSRRDSHFLHTLPDVAQ